MTPGECPETGSVRPRLLTPSHETGFSFGPEVAAWGTEHLPHPMMDWQALALDGIFAHDGSERMKLCHRFSLVTVARQNGKTYMMAALIGWWLTCAPKLRGGPQYVISTAHELDLAVALFMFLAPILEARYGASLKLSYGRQTCTMPDGSVWAIRAASPGAGHGRSPDLVVVDELWDVSDDVIQNGFIYSQRAIRSPLLAMFSTAGTQHSKAMIRYRERGLAAIGAGVPTPLFMAEWSPPPGVDIHARPELWGMPNPALGTTITRETLVDESSGADRNAWLRGAMNLWITADNAWLPHGAWDDARGQDLPDELPPLSALAVEVSPDESRYVGVSIHRLPDGRAVASHAFTAASELAMWDEVAARMPKTGGKLLVGASLDIHCPANLERVKQVVGYQELLKYTTTVRAMVKEGRLLHDGSPILAEHMSRAVAVRTSTAVVISTSKSPGPIELARACVWAAAFGTVPRKTGKPAMGRSDR